MSNYAADLKAIADQIGRRDREIVELQEIRKVQGERIAELSEANTTSQKLLSDALLRNGELERELGECHATIARLQKAYGVPA